MKEHLSYCREFSRFFIEDWLFVYFVVKLEREISLEDPTCWWAACLGWIFELVGRWNMSEGEKECLVVIVGLFGPAQLNTFFSVAHAYFELKTSNAHFQWLFQSFEIVTK